MQSVSHTDTSPETGFHLDAVVERIAHWLPAQRPIKDFVHHNTLHALEDHPFHSALAIAAKLFGAYSYLPLADYQRRYHQGRISPFALDRAIAAVTHDPREELLLRKSLFEPGERMHYPPVSLAHQGLRAHWLTHIEVNLNALVQPVLFRLLANFLDQGISQWTVARSGESFWQCVRRLVEDSFVPLSPLGDARGRALLKLTPDAAIQQALAEMVGHESLYEQYLLEMLLTHPGWSGMVRVIETTPEALLTRRHISLKELMAVELALEVCFLNRKRGDGLLKVEALPQLMQVARLEDMLAYPQIPLRLKVWHEAMEFSLHAELLNALKAQREPDQHPADRTDRSPRYQALFCIDDRECSLRRHLESLEPAIETFGAAGFFGIDFLYKGIDDAYAVAQCPVVITPRHLVVESKINAADTEKAGASAQAALHFRSSGGLLRNWIFTQTLGLGYAAKMAFEVFRPGAKPLKISQLSEVNAHTRLHLLRENEEPGQDGPLIGFSHQEMADKLEGLLRNIGLIRHFAPLVVVVAHGSSSVNNPHFAAYDCGACAGKPGVPNARAFAWMANDPAVRKILAERGIVIPDNTCFVPALHNTSRDEVSYYDQHLHQEPPPGLADFQALMQKALGLNATERCRWFELGPDTDDADISLRHVASRASSIFEPRPELNHSNNLYCVVGHRGLTRNLYMDRRAFLHSYDPATDPAGDILRKILTAIIPVCGGINLEYLFSRLDNSVYGAGTKLPHNVIGLLGVANGVDGDLRTGLPSQMVEVHEPARLLFVIEQTPDIILAAIRQLGALKPWLDNEWVRLAACHPASGALFWYTAQGFEPLFLQEQRSLPPASSLDIFRHQTATLPVRQLA